MKRQPLKGSGQEQEEEEQGFSKEIVTSQFNYRTSNMGQKVHPIGIRLGISKKWSSNWFSDSSSFSKNVHQDFLIRELLNKKLKDAAVSNINIERSSDNVTITIFSARPGIVIGRKGSGIRELTEKLTTDFGLKNPQISVNEIEKPDLSPSVMCNRMASHLERGTAFRRATMWTMKQIMESGAMGVQITISGKLRGDRSAFEKHVAGILPRAGHHAEVIVDEDIAHVETAMGLIGIRIRIANKEKVIPEFELIKEKIKKESKEKPTKKVEEVKVDGDVKVEVVKVEGDEKKAKSESEQIAIEAEKMKTLETLEEDEATMK